MINIIIFYILKFDIRKHEYNAGLVTLRMSRGEICIVLFYLELSYQKISYGKDVPQLDM